MSIGVKKFYRFDAYSLKKRPAAFLTRTRKNIGDLSLRTISKSGNCYNTTTKSITICTTDNMLFGMLA